VAGRMIRAARDHVLHANSTVVDRVDLATPLSLNSQPAPAPRLLPPRSGLERSDFVPWPNIRHRNGFSSITLSASNGTRPPDCFRSL
jgi:hypothetical protein